MKVFRQFILRLIAVLLLGGASGTIRAAPAPQIVKWTEPALSAALQINQTYPLRATASSGLPVSFELVTGPAEVAGATLTVTNLGTVILRATQSGNDEWLPAADLQAVNEAGLVGSLIGEFVTNGQAYDVQIDGTLAYIANGNEGLLILDVTDPTQPRLVSHLELPGSAVRLQVQGGLAYVAASDRGLQIVNVQDPENPFVLGSYDTPGYSRGVQMVGTTAYLADGISGLVVLDVTNPADPILLGGIEGLGHALSVRVEGNLAYVAENVAGLQIYDIRNPANPIRLGGLSHAGQATDVGVVDSYVFVAASYGGLQIVEVTDPAAPKLTGSLPLSGTANRVQVVDSFVYIAGGVAGLQMVDHTLKNSPKLAGGFTSTNSTSGMQVVGDLAYIADGTAGLRVVRLREGIRQQITFSLPARVLPGSSIPLEATASSGLPITYTLVRGPGQVAGNLLTALEQGTVVVRAEQAGDELILSAHTDSRVVIGPLVQSIQFQGPYEIPLSSPTVVITATASSGLPVFVNSWSGPAYRSGQNQITAVGTGTISLSLTQSGNANYLSAQLTVHIRVFQFTQQLSFTAPSRITLGDEPAILTATASSGLPVEFSVVSGPSMVAGNILTATKEGVVVVKARQSGGSNYNSVEAIREVLVLSSGDKSRSLADPSLQLDAQISGPITSLVPMADGSIIAAGFQLEVPYPYWLNPTIGQVIRLHTSGEWDSSFPSWNAAASGIQVGSGFRPGVGNIILRRPGELVVVAVSGTGTQFGFFARTFVFGMRLDNPAWGLLTEVPKNLVAFPDGVGGVILAGSDRAIIPGTFGIANYPQLSRIAAEGYWDTRFGLPLGMAPASGYEQFFHHILPLGEGGLIVAGALLWPFSSFDYRPNTSAFRLSPRGELIWHRTLDSPNWLTPAKFVAKATEDRLVLFPSREVLDRQSGARLGTFPIPAEVIAATTAYFQEPDGRLILSGTFTNYAGIRRRGLAAVFPDGSLDLSFDPGLGTTNGFSVIARQTDGSLLLAGAAGTFDGMSHRGLVRIFPYNLENVPPTQPSFYVQGPVGPLFECAYPGEIHVIRTGSLTQTNHVRVQTLEGSATAGADFLPINIELVFLPGERVKSVPLVVLRDDVTEETETFQVLTQFEPGTTVIGPNNLTVQIGNTECGIHFEANTLTLRESIGSGGLLAFATEYPPPGFTTRMRTRDLTAIAGRDYVAWESSPVVNPGVLVQVNDNPWVDGPRQFLVEAYDSTSGETITPDQSLTVTIADDDTLAGSRRGMAGELHNIIPIRDGWLMLGNFTKVDGWPRPGLARYNLGGEFDLAFDPPAELAGQVVCAAGLPDGGVLLGGSFARVGTLTTHGLVRLGATGLVDSAFQFQPTLGAANCPTTTNEIKTILVEPDGSSYLAGNFPEFVECEARPRLLRVSPEGRVEGSWLIPGHLPASDFRLSSNGHGRRILQGDAGVFAIDETGLTLLSGVELFVGTPLAVLSDGGLAGLIGATNLIHFAPDGTLLAEVAQFQAAGDIWTGYQLHSLAVRSDGRLLVSGYFQSTTRPPVTLQTMTIDLDPEVLAAGQVAVGEELSLLRLVQLVPHPDGPVAALNWLGYQQIEPKWWRLDSLGRRLADLEFSGVVMDQNRQFHLALRGQAPGGYAVEVSADLVNWSPWFVSDEVNWGQAFQTEPLPDDLSERFFRLTKSANLGP